jgi:hypothetical protein
MSLEVLTELNDQIAFIDHENNTEILEHVHSCIEASKVEKAGLSQSEYEELLADKLSLIELDSILSKDEDLRFVQAILRKIPGLVSSLLFA